MGGLADREYLEACWDVQSSIAYAEAFGLDWTVVLLDYYKFFDSFDPRFMSCMFEQYNFPQPMVDLFFLNLNTNARRYIKIGNTYGPKIEPYNALGQGDPFSLMAAHLYVHTLSTVLRSRTPGIGLTA